MTTAQVSANLHATGSIVPGKAGGALSGAGTAALDWETGDVQGAAVAGQAVAKIVPGSAGKALGAAAGGAAGGAALGTAVFPGIGTAVGAIAGGVIGLATHIHIGKVSLQGHSKLFDKAVADEKRIKQLRAQQAAKAHVIVQPIHAPPPPPPPPIPPRTIADSIVHEFVNEILADKGCPTPDQYLAAAHRALTKAQSEGLAVLGLVQQKVSLVESVGLAANGLTAQVNACRAPVTARATPRPVTQKPAEPPKSKKRVWLEVAGGGVGVVGIGLLAHRFMR